MKINVGLDAGIFGTFLIAMNPILTAIAVHEWFSTALGAALMIPHCTALGLTRW